MATARQRKLKQKPFTKCLPNPGKLIPWCLTLELSGGGAVRLNELLGGRHPWKLCAEQLELLQRTNNFVSFAVDSAENFCAVRKLRLNYNDRSFRTSLKKIGVLWNSDRQRNSVGSKDSLTGCDVRLRASAAGQKLLTRKLWPRRGAGICELN